MLHNEWDAERVLIKCACPKCGKIIKSNWTKGLAVAQSNHIRHCGTFIGRDTVVSEIIKCGETRASDMARKHKTKPAKFSRLLNNMVATGILEKERRGMSVYFKVVEDE